MSRRRLDRTEREAQRQRAAANAEARRLLLNPTPEERRRLRPLPPVLDGFLAPLRWRPESMRAVMGSVFFFSDVWAQTSATLSNIIRNPPVRWGLSKSATAESIRRLSSKTVKVRGRNTISEREALLGDDEVRYDIARAARALLEEMLAIPTVPRARREDERTFLAVEDANKKGVSRVRATREVAQRTRRTPQAVRQAVRRVARRRE